MPLQLRLPGSSTLYDYVELTGGLDLLTPTLKLKPGYVRDALNWAATVNGGYERIDGYERFDGRAAPSVAQYQTLTCNITGALSAGNTITGVTSGATGVVISIVDNIVAFTQPTGAFVAAETLNVGGTPRATITALGGNGPAIDYDVTQLALAANVYRALIQAVPGAGPIRGVARLNGVTYAWRNNAGNTAMAIYKHSAGGWVLVPLLYEVAFTAGTSQYSVGETLTQGSVNALIKGVALQSGAWGTNAAGRLIIAAPTGGNFAAGASVGGGNATLSGIQTAITMAPNGRVQTDFGNFDGTVRLYGCDGQNRGFEFDGDTYIPLATGAPIDIPKTVLVHKDHLWFGFDTNAQNSGIATPYNWTAAAGGAGWRVTGSINMLLRQSGDQSTGAMSLSTDAGTWMIYGNSAADFRLVPFEESAGAKKYGGQRLGGQSVIFSEMGVFSITAAQAFGNFTPASMTMRIRPFTQVRKDLCTGSLVNREKSQYRVFFSDGFGLYITIVNGKLVGSMPVFFPDAVTCCCDGETVNNQQTSFFGSTDGFVYRLDAGTSHDGDPIVSYFTLTFAAQGNSRMMKAYRGASFEAQGTGYAKFNVTYDLGYADVDRPQGVTPQESAISLRSAYWDQFTWDSFTWDGRSLGPTHVEMRGTGENVALRVDCSSDAYPSFTLNSAIIHYLRRKALKK